MSEPTEELVLLHNPKCSKSRAVKALLEERGLAHAERRYLDQPLNEAELRALSTMLGRPPIEFVRTKEAAFAEAGLSPESDEDALYRALAAHPSLLERPILIRDGRARVGRPPEAVLELL